MIWVTEADGSCSFLGKTWYEFTGRSPADSLGFGWIEAVHPDDHLACAELFLEANAHHHAFRHEYRLLGKDGKYHWVIDAALPRFDDNGAFLGYIGSVIDITDRKQVEEALHEREAALKEADRRKDEFLALLAHELRNPLAPIRTGLELMRLAGDDPVIVEDVRTTMERQTQQMVRLIDDLLDISRITRGTLELQVSRGTGHRDRKCSGSGAAPGPGNGPSSRNRFAEASYRRRGRPDSPGPSDFESS